MFARRYVTRFTALLLAQGLCLPLIFAQATTATVRGRVVDTDGSGVPGVVVVIKSKVQPSGNKQVVTDIEGNYRIPLLPPAGDYMIKIDYPGFAPMEVGPLDLDAGKTTVADITLRTSAETTETIVVESKGNIVDTESTKTTSSYSAEFIEGLPIIGHNYQDILTLAPGVTDTDGDGNPNVHGARDTGLQYRLDGGNITDPVSGTFGQNLNAEIIEELEVITSGASAEYGRADGGFANIITKSGGNDFEGKFLVYWRGKFLNGNGAANNNDTNHFQSAFPNYSDFRPTLNLGGAIVRDKLWYFTSVELLHAQSGVFLGTSIIRTVRGNYTFGKATWQVNSYNKLALQVVSDPLTFTGFGLNLGISPDSDYKYVQGGITPQIKWTSTISPQLLLEANVTRFDSHNSYTPISRYFTPTEVTRTLTGNQTIQAEYPCDVTNCDSAKGEKRTYVIDEVTGSTTGPYPFKDGDTRTRNAIKTDLSYNIEDAWGQHNIKSGIEFADEGFSDDPINNPILYDYTEPFRSQVSGGGGTVSPDAVKGVQILQTASDVQLHQTATSFNSAAYIQDAWKPRPNLTINLGVRIDREDIDTSGFGFFDPRQERRTAITLWRAICEEGIAQDQLRPGTVATTSNCHTINEPNSVYDGLPPTGIIDHPQGSSTGLLSFEDRNGDGINDVIPKVASLDLNHDGFVAMQGEEGLEQYRPFTNYLERETSNFEIVNNNLSPRLSVSWDPWADGKTKVFGNWSRYYDRLFLGTITGEIGPDTINYAFTPDSNTHIISPAPNAAVSATASTVSVTQIDRNMATPYTDELTIGFERELAPEWSAGVTYIKRNGYNLLQDTDFNHITCEQYGQFFHISPQVICGDAGHLEIDRFGGFGVDPASNGTEGGNFAFNRGFSKPNGAPDLYTVNNGFNQILRIGNFNSSNYESYELKILKRLHRNWQMQASYSWSKAFGQAEGYNSRLGNDPQTKDDEAGYLNFDQRHVLKFQAVTKLPKQVSLGTSIQWASGVPFSVIRTIIDQDSTGNTVVRLFYPTTQRNDQRNGGFWKIDGRLEKNFVIGKVQASAFISVENLLNDDYLTITSYNTAAFNGIGLRGSRDIGRRFEIGTIFSF